MSHALSPSRLPLRAQFHRERDIWVRGRQRKVIGYRCFHYPLLSAIIPYIFRPLL